MRKLFWSSPHFRFIGIGGHFLRRLRLWPRVIVSDGYTIKIYQPQVDHYSGDTVESRGAFSMTGNGKSDPVFGAVWIESMLQTNRPKRTAILEKIKVLDIKFAGDSNASEVVPD